MISKNFPNWNTKKTHELLVYPIYMYKCRVILLFESAILEIKNRKRFSQLRRRNQNFYKKSPYFSNADYLGIVKEIYFAKTLALPACPKLNVLFNSPTFWLIRKQSRQMKFFKNKLLLCYKNQKENFFNKVILCCLRTKN